MTLIRKTIKKAEELNLSSGRINELGKFGI
jgi:hypothetical protein